MAGCIEKPRNPPLRTIAIPTEERREEHAGLIRDKVSIVHLQSIDGQFPGGEACRGGERPSRPSVRAAPDSRPRGGSSDIDMLTAPACRFPVQIDRTLGFLPKPRGMDYHSPTGCTVLGAA